MAAADRISVMRKGKMLAGLLSCKTGTITFLANQIVSGLL